jgi:predicted nucleic acid binding AN1-type Zn finger protein
MEKEKETKQVTKKSNKCNICKKKCVINITCTKCEKIFCIKHRCPENHMCAHDYKKDFELSEKIISSKIEVI